jgi:hypothetical protein
MDVSEVKLPSNLNDSFFKRTRVEGKKGPDGSVVYPRTAPRFKPNDERKRVQIEVDKQIFTAINKAGEDKNLLRGYLGSYFKLRKGVYPHKLKF